MEKSKWRKEGARGPLWRFPGYDSREADARRVGHRHIFEGNVQIPAGKATFWKIGKEGFHSFHIKPAGFSRFWPPGEPPGRLLGPPGELLGRPGASRGSSWGALGASRGLPGELLAGLGPLLGPSFFEIKF